MGERPLQIKGQLRVQPEAIGKIQRRMGMEHLRLVELQLGAQVLLRLIAHFPLGFQPHRGKPQPFFEDLLHVLPVIGILVQKPGVGINIGVPGDADHRFLGDLIFLENLFGKM